MSVATVGPDVTPELGQIKQELLDARERARRLSEGLSDIVWGTAPAPGSQHYPEAKGGAVIALCDGDPEPILAAWRDLVTSRTISPPRVRRVVVTNDRRAAGDSSSSGWDPARCVPPEPSAPADPPSRPRSAAAAGRGTAYRVPRRAGRNKYYASTNRRSPQTCVFC